MTTYNTTNCKNCGARCRGDRCRDCEQMHSAETQLLDLDSYECPDCGGTTSGEGVTCFECRGGDE